MASLGRTPREFGSDDDSLNLTARLRLLPLDVNVARMLMAVFRHIFGGHDRRTSDLSSVHHIHHILNHASLNLTSQDGIEFCTGNGFGFNSPAIFLL